MTHISHTRRLLMQNTAIVLSGATSLATPTSSLAQSSDKVSTLSDALRWLDQMQAAPSVQAGGGWPLAAVLEHLSQSIEMSMDGFPQPKSALFQNTLGSAAFAFFKWRGRMSHSLTEPIPGAPALNPAAPWQLQSKRLREAIARFGSHQGALKPHFAYGSLSKNDYALAHAMHIANHQDEITMARLA